MNRASRMKRIIGTREFTDGSQRAVYEDDDCRQFVIDDKGHLERIDGNGYLAANQATVPEEDSGFAPADGDWRAIVFRQIKARRGQQAFRDSLRDRYGNQCLISGCALMDVVEAAHIKSYRGDNDNDPANGLLLRADLHTLFDLDLIGIEPTNLIVRVHPDAKEAGYGELEGMKLKCSSSRPSAEALALRWDSFRKRIGLRGS